MVEDLEKKNSKLSQENKSLTKKLESKISKYDKLKRTIKQLFVELTGEFGEGSNLVFRIKMCFRKVDLFKTCCINKASLGVNNGR